MKTQNNITIALIFGLSTVWNQATGRANRRIGYLQVNMNIYATRRIDPAGSLLASGLSLTKSLSNL